MSTLYTYRILYWEWNPYSVKIQCYKCYILHSTPPKRKDFDKDPAGHFDKNKFEKKIYRIRLVYILKYSTVPWLTFISRYNTVNHHKSLLIFFKFIPIYYYFRREGVGTGDVFPQYYIDHCTAVCRLCWIRSCSLPPRQIASNVYIRSWYDKHVIELYTNVAENACTSNIFLFIVFEGFIVGGIGSGSDTDGSGCFVKARGWWWGQFLRKCRRRWRHDIDAYLRGRTDGSAEEPLIRCCVSSSKNPFRPQCVPRAAHKKLFRTAAPRRRRLLHQFPFCFPSPFGLTHIRPHKHARDILSDCTLTHSLGITPRRVNTDGIYLYRGAYILHVSVGTPSRWKTTRWENINGIQIGLCVLSL